MKTVFHDKLVLLLAAAVILLLPGCSYSVRTKPPQAAYHAENSYMQMAVDEARDGIYNGDGGPFGCVIVKNDKVVGCGHNCVLEKKTPPVMVKWKRSGMRKADWALMTFQAVFYTQPENPVQCVLPHANGRI